MPVNVLIVDDNPGDVRLMQEVFREVNNAIRFHSAVDGLDAISYLYREGVHAGAARPDLIVLDLNMPRMDGREVLARVKSDDDLSTIPIIILTTSASAEDIVKSYGLQANCYLTKPISLDEFEDLVKSINDIWLTRARLPQQRSRQFRLLAAS